MSEFVVDINPDDWSKAFEVLDYYFVEDQDMMQALGIGSSQTLHDQRKGDREFIDSVVAGNVLKILNDTEPVVQLGDRPEDHIEDTYNAWGERAELEEGVAGFVFGPYTNVELAEKADVDKRRAVDYKNGESNPTVDLFVECFEEVSEAMNTVFHPEMDVYPVGAYSSPEYTNGSHAFADKVNQKELEEINAAVRDVEWLKEERPTGYTGIKDNIGSIEVMKDVVADPLRSEVSGSSLTSSSPFFHGVTEAGIAHKIAGQASNYSVDVSETYLDTVTYLLAD